MVPSSEGAAAVGLAAPGAPGTHLSVADLEAERWRRRQRLAASFRIFARLGYDEGTAGHITARDPGRPDHLWVNPFGMPFRRIRASDLVLVGPDGTVVEGTRKVGRAAFHIHSQVHRARPDVVSAVHAHSIHGKAWSTLGRLLDPITQESCVFYGALGLYDGFGGAVADADEGERIAAALGPHKAVILRNHGLLTVGDSVETAVYRFVNLDRSCQVQLLAEAAGPPVRIDHDVAAALAAATGYSRMCFEVLWEDVTAEQPDLLE
jgi:ribulose-5-phosphate 4-epimerase/fuculose-1-phosphate aldolase